MKNEKSTYSAQKQRLTELLEEAAVKTDCPSMEEVAEHLLANGVTVAVTGGKDGR